MTATLHRVRGTMLMTKADAMERQAAQVAFYAEHWKCPDLAAMVAAVTTADALADGEHEVVLINRHIPRGAAIEAIIMAWRGSVA